jgi:hypothetical protein
MTSNRARHELIQLPTITSSVNLKVRLLGTRLQSKDRPGDGPRFVWGRGRSPVPVPDLPGIGDAPRSPDLSGTGTPIMIQVPVMIGGSESAPCTVTGG